MSNLLNLSTKTFGVFKARKCFYIIALLLLVSPFTFININEQHDWGDDYAQYLDQAKDFILHSNLTGLEVLNYVDYSPKEKGAGFSLLISPIYFFYQKSVKHYIFFISIIYSLMGLVIYSFFKKQLNLSITHPLIALLLALVVLYNYHVFELKLQILPVFPFMLVLYSVFALIERKNLVSLLFVSILTGILISLKTLGWSLYVALVVYFIIDLINSFEYKKIKHIVLLFFVPISTLYSIKFIVCGIFSSNDLTWYEPIFNLSHLTATVQSNFLAYIEYLKAFFGQNIWSWANGGLKYSTLLFFILGFSKKIYARKIALFDVFFIVYILVILVYPYNKEGFRFLTPIFPIIVFYIYYGFVSLCSFLKNEKLANYIVSTYFIILLLSNYSNLMYRINYSERYLEGAQNKSALEVLDYINTLPENSPVAFTKPWALHYYTDKKALYYGCDYSFKEVEGELIKYNVTYLLMCTNSKNKAIYNSNLYPNIKNNKRYNKLFVNEHFVLFERNG